MDWRSPERARREASAGEYVVFHERPFPKRLDRAFRVGAVLVAALVVAVGFTVTGAGLYGGADPDNAWSPVALGAILAALAYGFVRAVGMMVAAIYQSVRPKQYVVDWQDDPPARG